MLFWFLQWLLDSLAKKPKKGAKIRFSETETTKHYRDFKKYQALEYPSRQETESCMLCRYICQTKKSPFEGDDDLQIARAQLRKNGIDPDKVL